MNAFGLQIRFANVMDPKLVIFQASMFGYCFGIPGIVVVLGSAPTEHGPVSDNIVSENGIRIWFSIRYERQQGGNNPKTATVFIVRDARHASDTQQYLCAIKRQATRTIGVLVLLLLLCPATRWQTPRTSPRADGIG